jgi:hypothetical protein
MTDSAQNQQKNSAASEAFFIELVSFDASAATSEVNVSWSTSNEINNDYFAVERSSDAMEWKTITTIPGKTSSTKLVNYNTADPSPIFGTSYYRLRQTSINGKYVYSKIETVEMKRPLLEVSTYPNPAQSYVQIAYSQDPDQYFNFSLLAYDGTVVLQRKDVQNGESINIDHLQPGIYLLNLEAESLNRQIKIIKN